MKHFVCVIFISIVLVPRLSEAETGGQDLASPAIYSATQQRHARAVFAFYSLGVVAGMSGIAPFSPALVGDVDVPASFAAATAWFTEPVLMLIADRLASRSLGLGPSGANTAGWVLYGVAAVLMAAAGVTYVGGRYDASLGLGIAGAVFFFPMQILTDVLGTRALRRATRVYRNEYYEP